MIAIAWAMASPNAKSTEANRTTKFRFSFAYFHLSLSRRVKLWPLTLILCLAAPAYAQQTPQEKRLFDQLNQSRKEAGLPSVLWDERLAEAARKHSELMASKNQLGHVLSGEAPVADRLAATGIRFNHSAENVGYDSEFNDLHDAWMKSPPHRESILNPDFNVVGIGVARGDDGLFYATQDFAHTVVKLTNERAAEEVELAVNRLRQSTARTALEIISKSQVSDLACQMARKGKLDAREASMLPDVLAAVTYNNSQPEILPTSVHKIINHTKFTKLAVGACFTDEDRRNPGGTFFVVVAFY